MSLNNYLESTSVLLHDESYRYTTTKSLTRFINQSRTSIARKTGCVRRLLTGQSAFGSGAQPSSMIPGAFQPGSLPNAAPNSLNATAVGTLQTIPGVERYPYQGFFNPVLRAAYAGIQGVIDVGQVSVNWGGSVRPALNWMPWDDFQAYCRAYANLITTFPSVWTVMDDGPNGEIFMFPAPSQVGDIELDAYCIPAYLYTDADYDVIPEGMQHAVQFGAAELAMLAKEKYAQAQYFAGMAAESIGSARVAFDRGKSSSYYVTNF